MTTTINVNGVVITLVILLVSGFLTAQISASGQLIIPSAEGDKLYKGVIRISRSELEIECSEKIFRLFNAFNTPMYRNIRVKTNEIHEICVSKGSIYILPENGFYRRYRHLFHPVSRIERFIPFIEEEKMALVFIMDNPGDIGPSARDFLDSINKRRRSKG